MDIVSGCLMTSRVIFYFTQSCQNETKITMGYSINHQMAMLKKQLILLRQPLNIKTEMLCKYYYMMENPFLDTVWQSGMSVLNWNSILSPKLHFVCCIEHRFKFAQDSNAFQTGIFPGKGAWHLAEGLLQENCQKTIQYYRLWMSLFCCLPSLLPGLFFKRGEYWKTLRLAENAWMEHHGKKKSNFFAELDVPLWPEDSDHCRLAGHGEVLSHLEH